MKIQYYFFIIFICIFSGCTKVKIDKEFSRIKKSAQKLTDLDVTYEQSVCNRFDLDQGYKDQLAHGITRSEAVGIALKNNPELQAYFDNLGVAKADLVEAGLYTNPRVESVFVFPIKKALVESRTEIEAAASFRISDLWVVPLTKKVAADLLEVMTLKILSKILDIVKEVSMVYDDCLYSQELLKNANDSLKQVKAFKNELSYRKNYGYTSDFEEYITDVSIGDFELDRIDAQRHLTSSFIHLKKLLGLDQEEYRIVTIEDFYSTSQIPNVNVLEYTALQNRPEIQVAQMKIKQYEHTVSLEKASVWDDVNLGVAYSRDFEKPYRGIGAYLSLSIPIFNDNHAKIARAEYLLRQSTKELSAQLVKIKEEIHLHTSALAALQEELSIFSNQLIPAHQKAMNWADKYSAQMQVTMLVPIQAKIDFYRTRKRLIGTQREYLSNYAQLERALGRKLIDVEK